MNTPARAKLPATTIITGATRTKEPRFRGFFSRRKGRFREPLSSKKVERRASRTDHRQSRALRVIGGNPVRMGS